MISADDIDMYDDRSALCAVSSCLNKIGTTQFNKAFSNLATGPFGADQCMIFSYNSQKPSCLLSYNTRPKGEARALAAQYVIHGYKQDPIQEYLQNMPDSDAIKIVSLDTLRDKISDSYWKEFYDAPGLVDKIAVLASQRGILLGVNFYRYEESGPYCLAIKDNSQTLWRIAAQLALIHYQHSDNQLLEDPLQTLSEREQVVCRWILKGLTTDAIAYEMGISPNTVATFRKRAYEKLAIHSKTALFALCQR